MMAEIVRTFEVPASEGPSPLPSDQLFADAVKEWLAKQPPLISPSSLAGYFGSHLNIFDCLLGGTASNSRSLHAWRGKRPTKMHEDTTPTSQVVYHIEQHQTVIIVDDSPRYYYVVEAKGEDDEHVKRGYVSKRSIHIIEETDSVDSPAMVQP